MCMYALIWDGFVARSLIQPRMNKNNSIAGQITRKNSNETFIETQVGQAIEISLRRVMYVNHLSSPYLLPKMSSNQSLHQRCETRPRTIPDARALPMGCGVVSGRPWFQGCWLIHRCWGLNALLTIVDLTLSTDQIHPFTVFQFMYLCNKVTGLTTHLTMCKGRPSLLFSQFSLVIASADFLPCRYQHTVLVFDSSYPKLMVFIDSDDLLQTTIHGPIRSDDEIIHSITRI